MRSPPRSRPSDSGSCPELNALSYGGDSAGGLSTSAVLTAASDKQVAWVSLPGRVGDSQPPISRWRLPFEEHSHVQVGGGGSRDPPFSCYQERDAPSSSCFCATAQTCSQGRLRLPEAWGLSILLSSLGREAKAKGRWDCLLFCGQAIFHCRCAPARVAPSATDGPRAASPSWLRGQRRGADAVLNSYVGFPGCIPRRVIAGSCGTSIFR